MSFFNIVLVHPEIPGNTGSIGRTCVALDFNLILIKPYGFDLSEKAVRRAGLDYWKYVSLKEYDSFNEFLSNERPGVEDLFFFSRLGTKVYYDAPFKQGGYLIFGSETKSLDDDIWKQFPEQFYCLPSFSDKIRSLNLANTVTAAAFEAHRHLRAR